jgi:iron complex outermembrane receptor protein
MKRWSFLLAAVAAPLPLLADEPQPLPGIVVTATRSDQDEVRVPASVRVITAAEIAAGAARHLVDVLREAGSLQVTDFYGDGSRAQVDARAFGDAANANTLVLVDGRRLNNPDIATPDLNSIALKDIERIEIIEGSAGALYGDQATGGVINIITRTARRTSFLAEGSGGSFGALGARAALDAVAGNFSGRLSAEHRGSDNYRDHNHVEYRNFFGRAGGRWSGGDAFVEAGYVDEDLQTPGALFASEVAQDRRQSTANYARDFSDTITRYHRAGLAQALGRWRLELESTRREADVDFRLSSVFGAATADAAQARDLWSLNPRVTGSIPLFGRDVDLTAGADFQRADYLLTSQFGTQQNRQRQNDGYAQAIVPLPGGVDVTVGGRAGRIRNDVVDTFSFPQGAVHVDDETVAQLGASWRALASLRVFARGERNYRYAKVDEFTFTSNGDFLHTQQGETWEAGIDWSARAAGVSATLFRLDNEQEIAFDPTGGFGFGANINLPATRRDGVLLRVRGQPAGFLQLAASGQYVDGEITEGPGLVGRDIPLAAATVAQASATFALPAAVGVQLGGRHTGARAFAGDFDNSLGQLPSHTVAHLALTWAWRALSLRARIDNLLDREYSEYGASSTDPSTFMEAPAYLPSPGRSYSLSARVEL